jgi:pSer/pThr/pTyr-binding forkhead associated (FHA) protein
LLAAALLLAFFGFIAWLIYRDIKLVTRAGQRDSEVFGRLRVRLPDSEPETYGREYPLYAVTKIGRAQSNAITLDDAFSSNEHVLIVRRAGKWWLEDLDSRNGTLLNEIALDAPAVLVSGDVVTVGRTSLEFDPSVSE